MRDLWPSVRLVGGALVLALLVWRFGTGPFADALRVTTWGSVALALVFTAAATLANAWRWRIVSAHLGVPLSTTESLTAYYRSQFLNSVLPGGVLGDAHRGTRHGREVGDLGTGLRATAWDRVSGQVVLAGLVTLAVVLVPTPLRRYSIVAVAAIGLVALAGWWLGHRRGVLSFVGGDLRVLRRPAVSGRLAGASCLSTAAYVAIFAVAVHTVGVDVGPALMVPLALVVLVGSAIPLERGRVGSARGRHGRGVRAGRSHLRRRADREHRVRGALGRRHRPRAGRAARRCRRTPSPSRADSARAHAGGGSPWLTARTRS